MKRYHCLIGLKSYQVTYGNRFFPKDSLVNQIKSKNGNILRGRIKEPRMEIIINLIIDVLQCIRKSYTHYVFRNV